MTRHEGLATLHGGYDPQVGNQRIRKQHVRYTGSFLKAHFVHLFQQDLFVR